MNTLKALGVIYIAMVARWFALFCGVYLWGALGSLIDPVPATLICLPVLFAIIHPDLRFITLFHIGFVAKLIGLQFAPQKPQSPSQLPLLPGQDRAWPQLPAPSHDREDS